MTLKLSPELSHALNENGGELQVVDPATNRIYVVIDQTVLKRAQGALQRQADEDLAAVRRGIEDVKAGRSLSLDQAHDAIRQEFAAKFGQ